MLPFAYGMTAAVRYAAESAQKETKVGSQQEWEGDVRRQCE